MVSIQFDGKVWKQGNSLLMTIPKEVRVAYDIKENDNLRVSATIITQEELEEEQRIRAFMARYSNPAQGYILYKGQKIAELHEVLYRVRKFRAGSLAPGDSFDKLPVQERVIGVILSGRFLDTPDKLFRKWANNPPYLMKNLTGTEIMKLVDSQGTEFTLDRIQFESEIIGKNAPNDPWIKEVEFQAHFYEKK